MGNKYATLKERVIAERNNILADQLRLINDANAELRLSYSDMLNIGGLTVTEAVRQLNAGDITSVKLVVALCYRAGNVGVALNLVTQTNFRQALRMAEHCDQVRKQKRLTNWTFDNGKYDPSEFLPPLFGIPISIKDAFHMEGFLTTTGTCSKAVTQPTDSPIVTCFRNSGLIIFVRSTCSQVGMAYETNSYLWGRSKNPWNEERATGGSSGGEGGLLASRCSIIGLGSDIGGSIRIPAEFCGLFALKPSSKRISESYHSSQLAGMVSFSKNIPLCLGPLGHSAEDLALLMKVATNKQFYAGTEDPYNVIVEFDDREYLTAKQGKQKYKIGYIKALDASEPTKSSSRALQQVIDILRRDGHELVEIQVPNEVEIVRCFLREFFAAGGKNFKASLDGEKHIQQYNIFFQVSGLYQPFRGLVNLAARMFMPRLYRYALDGMGAISTLDYQLHSGKIEEYKREWIKYWRREQLDFVVSPGFGSSAPLHGGSEHTSIAAAYTYLWNVLNMTVGAMPVTRVQADEQNYETRYRDLSSSFMKKMALGSEGLPVGIQIVSLPFQEEKVLGLMSQLEEKINFYRDHPLPEK